MYTSRPTINQSCTQLLRDEQVVVAAASFLAILADLGFLLRDVGDLISYKTYICVVIMFRTVYSDQPISESQFLGILHVLFWDSQSLKFDVKHNM